MRIYNFSEITGRKQNPVYHSSDNNRRRLVLPMASGGEDMVEISEQAIQRHQHGQLIALRRAKIEKIARELLPDVHNSMANAKPMDTHQTRRLEEIIITDKTGQILNNEALGETAELILGFLAG